MREGGTLFTALAAACAAALVPLSAYAVKPAHKVPVPTPIPVPAARQQATVDHPPVDSLNSFDNGPRADPRVALTFDADMTPAMLQQLRSGAVPSWYNREVRDILDQAQVPATIFLTGLWAAAYPEEARSLARDPLFELGDHSFDHPAFRTPCYGLPGAGDRLAEIASAQAEIESVTGVRPALFRFPGDCYDRSDEALAASQGLTVVSGDVRGNDGFNPSADSIVNTVLRQVQPGSIVLLHLHGGPNAPMTAPALRRIIPALRSRGLGFAKVSELLGRAPQPPPPPAGAVLDRYRAAALSRAGDGSQILAPRRLALRLRAPAPSCSHGLSPTAQLLP